jgi:hypothetical protein
MLMIASDIRRLVLRASILLFASVLSTTACRAADPGKFMVFGVGTNSCGKYLSETGRRCLFTWLTGYLTAFNHETLGVDDILGGTDIHGAIGWIRNYCQQHPTDDFAIAASRLTDFMMQKRRSEVSPPGLKENVFADLPPPKPAPMSSYVGDIAPDRPVSFNAPAQPAHQPKLGPALGYNPFAQPAPKPAESASAPPQEDGPRTAYKAVPVANPAESAKAERGPPAAKSEVVTVKYRGPVCEFRFNPAGDSDLMPATIPI